MSCASCHKQTVDAESIHADVECVSCHPDAAEVEHAKQKGKLALARCDECHEETEQVLSSSVHGEKGVRCRDCHGTHDIRSSREPQSHTYALNLPRTCGTCHGAKGRPLDGPLSGAKQTYSNYVESVHGRAISHGGLLVAANCSSCHGSHEIRRRGDPGSTVNRRNIASTCGHCHLGIAQRFQASVHGRSLAEGSDKAPVCVDCHSAHQIRNIRDTDWQLAVVAECGSCHPQSLTTFRDTFHGQVTSLGFTRVARCADCHSSHDILPSEDPASTVNEKNLVSTCGQCHAGASAGFVRYDPHPDHSDRHRDPLLYYVALFMRVLIFSVLIFFGVHVLLWLLRSLIERRRSAEPAASTQTFEAKHYRRFSVGQRVSHGLLMSSVLGLTATGLPLLYSQARWAKWISHRLGGFGAMGAWHRFFALILMGVFVVHVFDGLKRIFVHREKGLLWGVNSIVPQPRDVRDLWRSLRWFVGLGERPTFGRFTYWEKFDYLAVFWGMAIIGTSGIMLWFHDVFAHWMPGWWFNLALLIHGEEALLATTFIILVHFFNSHLRPDKFPMDLVIFTGRVSQEELATERAEEYADLVAKNALQAIETDAPPYWLKKLGWWVGGVAVLLGVVLLVLILIAVI